MILWRLAATARGYAVEDLSGAGAAAYPGRWNDVGQHVVYAAPTLALAVLETAAHIDDAGLPMNRYVVRIDVPEALWRRRRVAFTPATLPPGWDAIPSAQVALALGSRWYGEGKHLFLQVPAVIVPEESVVVINARHRDAASLGVRALRRYDYNALFRR